MMAHAHHVAAFADGEVIPEVKIEEFIAHFVHRALHVVSRHVRAHIVQTFDVKAGHERIDVLPAVEFKELRRVGGSLEGLHIHKLAVTDVYISIVNER